MIIYTSNMPLYQMINEAFYIIKQKIPGNNEFFVYRGFIVNSSGLECALIIERDLKNHYGFENLFQLNNYEFINPVLMDVNQIGIKFKNGASLDMDDITALYHAESFIRFTDNCMFFISDRNDLDNVNLSYNNFYDCHAIYQNDRLNFIHDIDNSYRNSHMILPLLPPFFESDLFKISDIALDTIKDLLRTGWKIEGVREASYPSYSLYLTKDDENSELFNSDVINFTHTTRNIVLETAYTPFNLFVEGIKDIQGSIFGKSTMEQLLFRELKDEFPEEALKLAI